MIKTSIEKLANSIGYDIGQSDDVVQSDLLNGFCRALNNSMNKLDREKQISYIVDKLDKDSEDIIEELYEFIKLKYREEE
jgi:hypothetical protein